MGTGLEQTFDGVGQNFWRDVVDVGLDDDGLTAGSARGLRAIARERLPEHRLDDIRAARGVSRAGAESG